MILTSVLCIMISHDLDKGTMVNHDLARLTMIIASVPWLRTLGSVYESGNSGQESRHFSRRSVRQDSKIESFDCN